MFVVLTEHTVNTGLREAARRRIADNGRVMAMQAGFVFRHLLQPVDRPDQFASMTGWASQPDYLAWLVVRDQLPGSELARGLYSSVENRLYAVWDDEATP